MSARMTSADAAWLHMDRPTNLMVISSLLLFDQPVDWEQVKRITQLRLIDRYPRFRQRVVEDRMPLRAPRWEDDPDFALEHHLHHLALPAPGDRSALQQLVGDLMTMPLDHSRPLWHTYMIDGYGDGTALLSRMHHCIADGISLARVMLSLTDSEPTATIEPVADDLSVEPARGRGGVVARASGLLAGTGRTSARVIRHALDIGRSPSHAAHLAGAIGRDGTTMLRLLLTPADPVSALKGEPGITRSVAWSDELSLSRIRRIAHSHEATVNDVLLAAVSGALRHYLRDRGSSTPEIQAMVPFNLRPLDEPIPRELGNRFGLVFLPLPVAVSGSYRRLREVHKRMGELKRSRAGAVSYALLSATGLTPQPIEKRIVDLFSAKSTAVMTNVPGPKTPVYVAGTPIRSVLFWAPTSGHIGMSVSIFSYRGQVTIGLMADAALVPDPEHIVERLEQELTTLARNAPSRRTRQGHATARRRRAADRNRRTV